MKKHISFFDIVYSLVIALAFYILMLGVSFILVSTIQYSHNNEAINYIENKNDIIVDAKELNLYIKDDDLYVIVEFKEKKAVETLLSFAYQYRDIYTKNVYLECKNVDTYVYICVNLDGRSTIS